MGGCFPKGAIRLVRPEGEELIEMGKMVARVGEVQFCHKAYEFRIRVPHGPSPLPLLPFVQADAEQLPGLGFIVKDPLAVPPAVSGEKESHSEIFFSIRGRTCGVRHAFRRYRPGEITAVYPLGHIHICFSPLPESVKRSLSIHLDTHHHAIGHAFGAHIMIACVLNIGLVCSGLVIKAVQAVEYFMKAGL